MSTRDVEDAFRDATSELLISKSAVYQGFITCDLSEVEVEYLFVDGMFEALRRHGAKEALLVAWAIAADGRKHLLHLAVWIDESKRCRTEFFCDIRAKLPGESASEVMAHLYAAGDARTPGRRPSGGGPADQHLRPGSSGRGGLLRGRTGRAAGDPPCPVRHRIRVRTTNLAERSFIEERRRTKVVGRFSPFHRLSWW